MEPTDIDYSIIEGNKGFNLDDCSDVEDENDSIFDKFILKAENPIVVLSDLIYVLVCLGSAYFYMWCGTFEGQDAEILDTAERYTESFFAYYMILKFMSEYNIEGELMPIRDPQKIANHYLRGSFVIDLIPLLPL